MTHLMLASLEILYRKYRHVAVKIESTWGTTQCDELLHSYLVKNRDTRLGFCPSIYKEILNLYIIHRGRYGSRYTVLDNKDLNVDVEQP